MPPKEILVGSPPPVLPSKLTTSSPSRMGVREFSTTSIENPWPFFIALIWSGDNVFSAVSGLLAS